MKSSSEIQSCPPDPWIAPQGYRWLATLAEHRGLLVGKAELHGRPVVLRLERGDSPRELLAELGVLAQVEHPGLARLVDHGLLPGRDGRYVARDWIEGVTLQAARGSLAPPAIGDCIARLCRALQHLHDLGFVHADLKAENVILRGDGEPVLTDFGLALPSGITPGEAGVQGSYFGIAPELFFGASPTPQSDLFSLGVMLYDLLAPIQKSPQEFYGLFPARGFFEALGSSAARLPEWARDLVERLLDRDPARRPGSAAEVARLLEGRLSLKRRGKAPAARIRLRWPLLRGQEEFALAELSAESRRPSWWNVGAQEDPARLVEALALHLALAGRRVQELELARSLEEVTDARALDQWARGRLLEAGGGVLLVAATHDDEWSRRALVCLARTWEQRALRPKAEEQVASLCVLAAGDAPIKGYEAHAWPRVREKEILEFLHDALDEPDESRLEQLAARLHAESAGTRAILQQMLDELAQSDWLRWSRERPSLRSGELPDWLGRRRMGMREARKPDLAPLEQSVLAALQLAGNRLPLARLAAWLEVEEPELARALESLQAAEWIQLRRSQLGHLELELLTPRGRLPELELAEERWRALAGAQAAWLASEGAHATRWLPLQYRADPSPEVREAIGAAMLELVSAGNVELALDFMTRVAEVARSRGSELEPDLIARQAHVLALLGSTDRSMECIARVEQVQDPNVRALLALARGSLARLAQDHERALAEYKSAAELGFTDRGELLLARARLLVEGDRREELEALFRELDPARERRLAPGVRINLRSLRAMMLFRRGELAAAEDLLERSLAEAQDHQDPGREASIHINLGTLARRAARLERAVEHFQRAEELYERAGLLSGVAQARTLLGGLLRERGDLHEASELLLSALEMRERLGEEVGAAAVRGTLGLLWLERGHLQAGIAELEPSAQALEGGARAADARLLRALAREAAVRAGRSFDAKAALEIDPEHDDPRALLALGRSALVQGEEERARKAFVEAERRASALGRVGPAEEARWLLCVIGAGPRERWRQPEVVREAEIFELVRAPEPEFDAVRARALAEELAAAGRDDRAARLFLRLAACGGAGAKDAKLRAEDLLEACGAGLLPTERGALTRHLLSLPDPRPKDLEALQAGRLEEIDMDVLAVLEINHRLVEQRELPALLGQIVESALALTHAERGFLVLEENGALKSDLALDSRRGDIDEPEMKYSHTIVRRALQEGRTLRLSNATDDPLVGMAPSVAGLDLRSILCQPFEVQPGLRGAIYLDHSLRTGAFSDRAERLLALLADQAALAIRHVRQLEEIHRLNDELGRQVVAKDSDLRAAQRALARVGFTPQVGGLVGESAAMRRVHDLLRLLGPSELPVLVSGESGTGKELAARALHDLSSRKERPFVSENCAALPPTLIESELFGHKRGAFTGADRDREGLFDRANGGTLFLDEIGELPPELQAKLLRVLETREVRRLGDAESRKVDFRLVAATNRDLAKEVEAGRFRSDLYYRLDAAHIDMPPLQDRSDDVPLLVDHFLRLEAARTGRRQSIAPAVLQRLCDRSWPGNVRELANEIARLCVLSAGDIVDPALIREARGASRPVQSGLTLAELERQAILDALQRAGGDKRAAADMLGISRAKIYQRLKEWREGGDSSIPA